MSEANTAPTPQPSQERALQKYLLDTTIAVKGGGGLVFPDGLFGTGYRLDEWQFDRYRAAVDQVMLSTEAAKLKWVMLGAIIAYFAIILALAFLLPEMRENAALAPYAGLLTPIFVVLLATAALLTVFRLVRRRAMPFKSLLVDAPRVSRFRSLRARTLALLAAGHVKLPVLYIRIVLYCVLVVVLFTTDLFAEDRPVLRVCVSLLLLLSAARRGYFVFIYWSFRLRHGRAPRPEDLQPVDEAATRAA